MEITLVLGSCVVGIALYYYYINQSKAWRILSKIPGPPIWPIIGNLQFIEGSKGGPAWNKTWHLAKKYGPVMRLQLGAAPLVLLSSYDAIYEALVTNGKKIIPRPKLPRVQEVLPKFSGVIFNQRNDQWKTLRRAFLTNFKYYGSGKSHLEPIVLEVLQGMIRELRETAGESINPRPIIFKYFSSVMFVLNFGEKPTKQEAFDNVRVYDQELIQYINPFGDGHEIDVFPWYRKFGLGERIVSRLQFVRKQTEKLWSTYGKKTVPTPENETFTLEEGRIRESCFAATLNAIVSSNKDNGFIEEDAMATLADTFIGGLTTSTQSLHFLFNILLHYPDIQSKLHQEIDRTLGANKEAIIITDMKEEMPYLQATLYELLRYTSILPFGLPHVTEEDTMIQGHLIPKDTILLMHTWYLHHDDFWERPFEFIPERFIGEDGKLVSADHPNRLHWMPFGAGVRVCAGMVLAMNRYFLTIGNVMRHFRLVEDPSAGLSSCSPVDGKPGLFIHGHPYTIRFIERQL